MMNDLSNDSFLSEVSTMNIIETHDLDVCKDFTRDSKNLRLLTLNIRSLNKNLSELMVLLNSLNDSVDVMVLTECRLMDCESVQCVDGYKSFSTSNNRLQNDGVVIYLRNCISCDVQEHVVSGANCLQVNIENSLAIIAIYRSPSGRDQHGFLDGLSNVLNVNNNKRHLILTGDLNINILESNNSQDYLNTIAMYGMKIMVNAPTRVAGASSSCLDHYMVRSDSRAAALVFQNTITDHFSVFFRIQRDFGCGLMKGWADQHVRKRIDFDMLKSRLNQENWQETLNSQDVNNAAENFISILKENVHKCTVVMRPNKKRKKSWITAGIVKCLNKRDRLHALCRRDPYNSVLSQSYKKYRNVCSQMIRSARELHYKDIIDRHRGDIKATWKTVKEAANIGTRTVNLETLIVDDNDAGLETNPEIIANHANRFFATIGARLAEDLRVKIGKNDEELCSQRISEPCDSLFSMVPVTESEISVIVSGLRAGCGGGVDQLGSDVYKRMALELVTPLTHIVNLSLRNGVFPTHCKEAIVIPIHKDGDEREISNYRPISFLNILSKIIETAVKKRLMDYLNTNNLISPNQYGFREGMGTCDAILTLTQTVASNMDVGLRTMAVFLDLAKAFDTVSHALLLKKLTEIGILGQPLDWFKSYLADRSQKVRLGDRYSDSEYVRCGVPQGSVLGPVLFLVFINDLCNLNVNGRIITFADDTTILFTGNSWTEVRGLGEEGMQKVKNWLNNNLLSLNTNKTNFMLYSHNRINRPEWLDAIQIHSQECMSCDCDCPSIEKKRVVKYLGTLIDSRLAWEDHIDKLVKKLRTGIYIYRNLRNILNKETMLQVYYALTQSLLAYSIEAWGGCANYLLDRVAKTQKTILKVILRKPIRYPTMDLFEAFPAFNIKQLFARNVLCRFQRHITVYVRTQQERVTRGSTNVNFVVPFCRTTSGQRQYYFIAPKLYNSLPPELKSIKHTIRFKCAAKDYVRRPHTLDRIFA
jgi:exonuclease III